MNTPVSITRTEVDEDGNLLIYTFGNDGKERQYRVPMDFQTNRDKEIINSHIPGHSPNYTAPLQDERQECNHSKGICLLGEA